MIIRCPNCTSRFNLNAELLGEAGRNVKCAKCTHRWFVEPPAGDRPAAAEPVKAPPPPPPPVAPPQPPAAPPAPAKSTPKPRDEPEPEDDAEDSEDSEDDTGDDAGDLTEDGMEEDTESAETPSPPPIPSEEEIARFQARPPQTKSTIIWWIVLFLVVVALVTGTVYFRRDIAAAYPSSNRLFLAIGLPTDTLGYGLKIHDPKTAQRSEGDDRILVITGEIENETGAVIDLPLLRGAVKNTRGKELYIWSFKTKEPRVLAGEKSAYETEVRNPPPGSAQLSITFTRESEMIAEKEKAKAAAAEMKEKAKAKN